MEFRLVTIKPIFGQIKEVLDYLAYFDIYQCRTSINDKGVMFAYVMVDDGTIDEMQQDDAFMKMVDELIIEE